MSEIEKVKEAIALFRSLSERFRKESEESHHDWTTGHYKGASTAYRLAAEHLERIFLRG